MARSILLTPGQVSVLRAGAGAIAADNTTLTDANVPPASAVDCWLYDTIFVGVEITAGTSPTMTIEPLFRDSGAADGARWRRLLIGANPGVTLASAAIQSTGALAPDLTMYEIQVFGCRSVFFRISAVANATNTTAWSILGFPGRARNVAMLPKG